MSDLTGIAVSAAELGDAIAGSDAPLLVDFWAPWCGTCKLMSPSITRLHRERPDGIRVAAFNVEEDADIAQSLGVKSLPTVALYHEGREIWRHSGMKAYAGLVNDIEAALKGSGRG